MGKRDYIEEIEAKNARATPYTMHGLSEIFGLRISLKALSEPTPTLLSLHLMGVASCIEVGVRESIKRLVNHGSPYIERASTFSQLEFDFSLTFALSAGRITFGDLVSHLLPVSRVGHIAGHFETLFNDKKSSNKFSWMLSQIREFREPDEDTLFGNESSEQQEAPPLLLKDTRRTLKLVTDIFEQRHLVAHEAKFDLISCEQATEYVEAAEQFLEALYEMVEQTLNPGASRSGFGSSIQNQSRAAEVACALGDIEAEFAGRLKDVVRFDENIGDRFAASSAAFQAYLDAEESFRFCLASPVSGNAMRNISSDVIDGLCEPRLQYLRKLQQWLYVYID